MTDRLTVRAQHLLHADERNRVSLIERHEREVRDHERERILAHIAVPMHDDETGFCPGGKV